MRSKINQFFRLCEIVLVSLSFLFYIFIWSKIKKEGQERQAIFLRKSLEKLGSVFIKFGQMLALRPDFLSDVYCNELYKLLDNVPSFPKQYVEEIINKELDFPISELFSKFDIIPIASASFAQVHKARLKDGNIVAVKVQRPNIKKNVDSDLSLLRKIAFIVDIIFKPANKLITIVEEFEIWTQDELDYELEAENIEKFSELQNVVKDDIRGPKVYLKYSTKKVLVMEFVDGFSLSQIIQARRDKNITILNKLKSLGFDDKEVVNNLIRNTLEMSHINGFFHADPHPANIIFNEKGELVFIDFGIVGTLSKKERVLILRYLRSMLTGNSDDAFNSLVSLCGENTQKNLEEVRKGYDLISEKLVSTFDSKTYLEQQKQSGPILVEVLNLLQRNGFKVPVSIVRYFKAFETIEGLIFALYPELQIKNMVKEFRRVSILNIIDSLPEALEEKNLNDIMLKLISSIEDGLLLR
ncbi:MAG: ABC-1 domain-containing protein [Candidatus Roizmanbacteria bacterium GW2011_GWA2_35_19]|uniref:ABC-1 domain-containing protein n=2 Tax=Candidatus Roizmaniibacteriota TaxID=1752723 RepID=A0A0G0EBY9_9BACT|nr:MAG: ABC-1 domain-containing protein [Candidatus Roizmanbacteria bacterium GW2011_GWC2_35_12]KKP72705.1 MAG: ABC-1 domain-containing protein [Candidatus Roizmanbacteria bacterium GW2011_GWA2_35_19]